MGDEGVSGCLFETDAVTGSQRLIVDLQLSVNHLNPVAPALTDGDLHYFIRRQFSA